MLSENVPSQELRTLNYSAVRKVLYMVFLFMFFIYWIPSFSAVEIMSQSEMSSSFSFLECLNEQLRSNIALDSMHTCCTLAPVGQHFLGLRAAGNLTQKDNFFLKIFKQESSYCLYFAFKICIIPKFLYLLSGNSVKTRTFLDPLC